MAQKGNLTKLANAVMHLFPLEFSNLDMLVPVKGRGGPLFHAAFYRVDLERKKKKDLNEPMEEMENVEDADAEEIDLDKEVTFLRSACGADKTAVERALKATYSHRRDLLLENGNIRELLFGFFISHPTFISFEFNLAFPGSDAEKFSTLRFNVLSEIESQFKPVKQNQNLEVPDDVQPFLILFRLIGHAIAKRVTERDNFVTSFSRILEFYPHNTPNDTILLESTNLQPFLVGKYAEDVKHITQYLLILRPHIIPLNQNFQECYDLLFKSFHIFNFEYPYSTNRFYKYFEEFVYNIHEHNNPQHKLLHVKIINKINELERQQPQAPENVEERDDTAILDAEAVPNHSQIEVNYPENEEDFFSDQSTAWL